MSEPFRGAKYQDSFISIQFQEGLPPEVGVNGTRIEDVVDVLIGKIRGYQMGSLPCHENEEAIAALIVAKDAMVRRRQRRMLQGVFNTKDPHKERTEDVHEEFSATGA